MDHDHRIKFLPLYEIELADKNPKRHQLDQVKLSITEFGYVNPAVMCERRGQLVAGNGRTTALREMHAAGPGPDDKVWPPRGIRVREADGAWLVPVSFGWASENDTQFKAYLVADNRHTELGGWDMTELNKMLAEIHGAADAGDVAMFNAAGFTDGELSDMVRLAEPIDLDSFGDNLGDPPSDAGWPTIKFKVPHHVSAAWRALVEEHKGKELEAFASMLGVDAEVPGGVEWKPDQWENGK